MTHDDLLKDLTDKHNYHIGEHTQVVSVSGCNTCKTYYALRAVVELHKPIEISGEELCDACEEWTNEGAKYRFYPCPTIQAIDKELG